MNAEIKPLPELETDAQRQAKHDLDNRRRDYVDCWLDDQRTNGGETLDEFLKRQERERRA